MRALRPDSQSVLGKPYPSRQVRQTAATYTLNNFTIVAFRSAIAKAREELRALIEGLLRRVIERVPDSVEVRTISSIALTMKYALRPPPHRPARNHLKARRERLKARSTILLILVATVLVINEKAAVRDLFEFAVGGILEVELGEPY